MKLHRVDHGDDSPAAYFTDAKNAERFRREQQAAAVETVDAVKEIEAAYESLLLAEKDRDNTLRVLADLTDNCPMELLRDNIAGKKAIEWLRGYSRTFIEHYEYRLSRARNGCIEPR